MTTRKHRFPDQKAFVTNELFIVLALFAVGIFGAVILARTLHLGWLASSGVVLAAILGVYFSLSFLDAASRRNRK